MSILIKNGTLVTAMETFASDILIEGEEIVSDLLAWRHPYGAPLAEIVAHRFVYRPGDAVSYADAVELRQYIGHGFGPDWTISNCWTGGTTNQRPRLRLGYVNLQLQQLVSALHRFGCKDHAHAHARERRQPGRFAQRYLASPSGAA